MSDQEFILQAIEQAKESVKQGGFPAGTIIVKNGEVIARGISIGNILHDPTSHGEVSAIREASKINVSDLSGATIYSSMEPCMMCLAASMWAGVSRIVFACGKEKVSPEYYGGKYKTEDLNEAFLKKIEVMHLSELENDSFQVVSDWEKSLSK